jgi:hypothetical protein
LLQTVRTVLAPGNLTRFSEPLLHRFSDELHLTWAQFMANKDGFELYKALHDIVFHASLSVLFGIYPSLSLPLELEIAVVVVQQYLDSRMVLHGVS